MAKRDYYDVLGVSKDASADQIRTAYRKLARKFHPDVNKASDAATKFKEATEAYEVLGDAQKRKMYDEYGFTGQGAPFGGAGPAGGQPGRAYRWSGGQGGQGVQFNVEDIFGGGQGFGGMNFEDLMEALGAGRRGGRRTRGVSQEPPSDIEYDLSLDFLEAARGTSVSLQLQGPGGEQTLSVKIPPGVDEGSKIRLRGKGRAGGDLYIITHIREHPYFRRQGTDLLVDLPISITEAAIGAKVDVPTLEGTSTVAIPPGSSSGRKLRLREKGISSSKGRGDLYVVLKVMVPPDVSEKGAELLRQFQATEKFDPRKDVPWKK